MQLDSDWYTMYAACVPVGSGDKCTEEMLNLRKGRLWAGSGTGM